MGPLHNIFAAITLGSLALVGASVPPVEERVRQIIMDQLGLEASAVKLNTSFADDLAAGSLDLVEVVMGWKRLFALEIPDGDAENIRTVQDAVDYIQRHAKSVQQ